MITFDSFLKGEMPKFKTMRGQRIDNVSEYIVNYLNENKNKEIRIYLGSDSQVTGAEVVYVTAIVLYQEGKGGHVLYHKEKWPREGLDFKNRLTKELHMSYEMAEYLETTLVGFYRRIEPEKKLIDIDIDFNPDIGPKGNNKSNTLFNLGVGWMEGSGYRVRTKPLAIAASYAADRLANP